MVTVMVKLEVLPVPPSLDVTVVELVFTPAVVPTTLTEKVQEAFAASVAPERAVLALPAVAVMVPPPHDPVRPFGVETTMPDGKLSVNATPVSVAALLGLLIVKVSEVVPLMGIELVPKALVMVGGDGVVTVMVKLEVLPAPPSLEVTAPVTLAFMPALTRSR